MDTSIRNIIFDLGGVLYDLDTEGCLQAFEQAGLDNVRQLITGTNEAGIFQAYETGEISTPRFREEVRRLCVIWMKEAMKFSLFLQMQTAKV